MSDSSRAAAWVGATEEPQAEGLVQWSAVETLWWREIVRFVRQRSRLVGAYMVFYSIGSAGGAIAATAVYARTGWIGVCLLGAAISATALALWATAERH